MKLKVWQVIWGLKDGGAENLARIYADSVNKNQFESTIITIYPFENTANYRRAVDAGLRVLSVFKRRNMFTRFIRAFLGKWYIPFMLKRLLMEEKPDIIHFNSQIASVFLSIKKILTGKRLIYTCHSEVDKYFHRDEEVAVQELLEQYEMRLIALHEDMRKELNERFEINSTIVIKNGVYIDRFRKYLRPNIEARRSIGISTNAFVVGHVGRFSKPKNHIFLLKVFREILERKPNAHLLLIGNGELETEIRAQITEMNLDSHVTILSHRTDIPELLSTMDVMVFPSFFEGLSVTLVEAQASGLRCIVSDSVNPENFLLNTTIPISLNAGVSAWANAALDDKLRNTDHGSIEDYDMKREIRRLEQVYRGYDLE